MKDKLLTVEDIEENIKEAKNKTGDFYNRFDLDDADIRCIIANCYETLKYAEKIEQQQETIDRLGKLLNDDLKQNICCDCDKKDKEIAKLNKGIKRYIRKVTRLENKIDFLTGKDELRKVIEKVGVSRYIKKPITIKKEG